MLDDRQTQRSQDRKQRLHAVTFVRPDLESPHRRAVRRLALELRAEEGLRCYLHSPFVDNVPTQVLPRGEEVHVAIEQPLRIAGCEVRPDLTVRCARTGRVKLLVEVWHTHAVGERKRQIFAAANFPWIEVRSWKAIWRRRHESLCVADWGGLPCRPPDQVPLP